LVERGARTTLTDAATLGLIDRVEAHFGIGETPTADAITGAFWGACHGGQRQVAEFLLARDADINWIGHGGMTPLDIARREDAARLVGRAPADDLVRWLEAQGAQPAKPTARRLSSRAPRSQSGRHDPGRFIAN
jgi:hypothetical protein